MAPGTPPPRLGGYNQPQAPRLRERTIVSRRSSIEKRSLTANAPLRKAGLAARLLALPALGAGAASLCFDVRAAVEHAGGLAGRIAGPVGLAARRQARLAGSAAGGSRCLAAPGAESLYGAPCRLAAGPLAPGGERSIRIPARLACCPQPGVAGAARPVPLFGTRVADAALRRGRAVAAPGTKTLCNAFRSALAEAFAVALAAHRRVSIGHRRPPSI